MEKRLLALLLALVLCLGLSAPALAEEGDDGGEPEQVLWLQWCAYDWDAGSFVLNEDEIYAGFQPHPGDYCDLLFGTIEFDEEGEAILESFQPVPMEELTASDGVNLDGDFGDYVAEGDPYIGCYVEVSVDEWEKDYWIRWKDCVMYFDSNLPDFGMYTAPEATPESYASEQNPPHSWFGSAVRYVGSGLTDEEDGRHLVSASVVDGEGAPLGDNDLFTLEKVGDSFWRVQVLPEAREQECVRMIFSLCFADADGNEWTDQWQFDSWFGAALLYSEEPLFQTIYDEAVPFAEVKDKLSDTLKLTVGEAVRVYVNQIYWDDATEGWVVGAAPGYAMAARQTGLEVVYEDDLTADVRPVEVRATAPGDNGVYWSYVTYYGVGEDGTEVPVIRGYDTEKDEMVYLDPETGEAFQGKVVRRPRLVDVGDIPLRVAAAAAQTVHPSGQTVTIDGKKVEFQMYSVKDEKGNDTNYIKIRDLAKALKGTAAEFNVGKADGVITFTGGAAYTPDGTEDSTPYSGPQACTKNSGNINVNGTLHPIDAFQITYNGGGYTYFQLKDVARKLNFNVAWRGGIVIETDKPYTGK